jgi:hypothetical protein
VGTSNLRREADGMKVVRQIGRWDARWASLTVTRVKKNDEKGGKQQTNKQTKTER